jgi:Trk K+ transport system NAD-binding subunit
MKRAQIDGFISEDGLTGRLIVQEFINPGINEVISQVLTNSIGSQFYICDTSLINYQIRDVQISALEHDINMQVIGITRNNENLLNPSKDTVINKGDKLIVLAENSNDYKLIPRRFVI